MAALTGRPIRLSLPVVDTMKNVKCIAGIGVAAIALLAGCGPAVRPVGVRLTGISLTGSDAAIAQLTISNPNAFALDMLSAEYRVLVGDNVCGSGRRTEPLHVGGRDSTAAEFAVTIDYASLAKSLPAMLKDTVTFKVDGSYAVKTLLGQRRLPFKAEHNVTLKQEIGSFLERLFNGEE